MECVWCGEHAVYDSVKDCYWVSPDGTRSLKILQVPALSCPNCGSYITEAMNQKIEESLYVSDLSAYPNEFTYSELLKAPARKLFPYK